MDDQESIPFGTLPCEGCGEPGRNTQGPWPLPVSMTFCDLCYEMEGIAYNVWRELNPKIGKYAGSLPLLKITGIPDNPTSLSLDELKEFFRNGLRV
jgi:hypothetical protein